ncbi:hypothetical protein [Yersinia phage fHe-Yen9-03]|uniref:Uncharacterized protein n=1 Tax=Yersinia phage fHe-Yen9-03 TaxID=2052743 RepID=A0A2C9CYD9_9CAUD|nr:hypothetical protein [Yersinia phage fHe-Yen9-03]
MRTCKECGNNCNVLSNGVVHHYDEDDKIDYDLDGDHVAIPELSDSENNMLNPILQSTFNFNGDVPCINYAANGGGYETYQYFICADGGCLGIGTVINEFHKVNFNDPDDKQWHIVGVDVNYENTNLIDDHTGDYIPVAYS